MRSAGLRNKPIDRRYLNKRDRSDLNQSGEYGRQAQALARTRAFKGAQAYQENRPPATTTRRPGSGSLNGKRGAIAIQSQRLAEKGRINDSQFKGKKPSKLGDVYGPEK